MNFDTGFLQNISVAAAAAVPIIVAITQAFKFWVPDKYAPFVSILAGIVVSFLLVHDLTADLTHTLLAGILFGLSASGLYSGLRSTQGAILEKRMKEKANEHKRGKQNG